MVMNRLEGLAWLRKQVESADKDILAEIVKAVVEALMGADADNLCGAPFGVSSPERVNRRNGYRQRRWDTRVGSIELSIPKLRKGRYFPSWLLEPRRRSERSLVQVVVECYVRGVSTRRVDGLVQALGLSGMSKSQVSELAKELDQMVESFRNRPLDQGPYTCLWLDAMDQRCREGGRVVNVATVIATAVNGHVRQGGVAASGHPGLKSGSYLLDGFLTFLRLQCPSFFLGLLYGLERHIPSGHHPLVVLLGQHRAHQPDYSGPVGKDTHHIGAAPDLAVEALLRVVGPYLAPHGLGKGSKGQDVFRRIGQKLRGLGETLLQLLHHPAMLGPDLVGAGLGEDGAHPAGHQVLGALGHSG